MNLRPIETEDIILPDNPPQEESYSIINNQLQQTVLFDDIVMFSEFPELDPNTFYTGLPGYLEATTPIMEGEVIDFVRVPWIAKTRISGTWTGGTRYAVGFQDRYGNPVTLPFRIDANRGEIAFYELFGAASFRQDFPESRIVRGLRWVLLSDFGGISPGSTASQTIQLSYGFNESQTRGFAVEVGASLQGNLLPGLLASLSSKVTQSFSQTTGFSENLSISTTVNYNAQPRAQRIGVYQYCTDYTILPGPNFQRFTDNNNFNPSAPLVPKLGTIPPTIYTSNRFQKVFVLEPL